MGSWPVWRWVIGHAVRRPGTWGLVAVSFFIAPLTSELSPLGSVGVHPALAASPAWSVPLGLLGAVLGLLLLGRHEAFLRLLPGRIRWGGEAGALGISVLGLTIPLWLGAAVREGALPGAVVLADWGIRSLHVVALGLLLLRWNTPGAVRAAVLVTLVWIVPGFLAGSLEGLRPWFDGGAPLAPTPWRSAVGGLAATAALFLASFLLACPRSAPQPEPR